MKRQFTLLLAAFLPLWATALTLTFSNPTALQRHEVAAVALSRLSSVGAPPYLVKDAFGLEQPYQLTHDGQLLLFVSVRPHAKATYTVEQGQPAPMKSSVFTKLYPERLDDIVIENDRTGYRFYGPALQQRGEKGYGIDLWLKNTPELIIDSLYRLEFSLHPQIGALRKQGRMQLADSLQTLTSFHINHGLGMDCYNVGPTLGCGTPALLQGNDILFPWCYDSYRVLDNGPLRLTIEMTFKPEKRPSVSDRPIVEHRRVTLDRGANFARMDVWYDGLMRPTDVCAGFVLREGSADEVVLAKRYMLYADPTGDAQRHNCQIFVATLFPEGKVKTRRLMMAQPANGNSGHAIGMRRGLTDKEKFTYYFGSAWSQYDVRSLAEWRLRTEDFITAVQQPFLLTVNAAE